MAMLSPLARPTTEHACPLGGLSAVPPSDESRE